MEKILLIKGTLPVRKNYFVYLKHPQVIVYTLKSVPLNIYFLYHAVNKKSAH